MAGDQRMLLENGSLYVVAKCKIQVFREREEWWINRNEFGKLH
jgi:hypothetical protein